MATTTTTLSGSYLDNWNDFTNILTSSLDPDNDGIVGNDGKGPTTQKFVDRLDKLDRFFSSVSGGDPIQVVGPGLPTKDDFLGAADPDNDGFVGGDSTRPLDKPLDRAVKIYDKIVKQLDRNTVDNTSTTLFGASDSIGLGVVPDSSRQIGGTDAVIFGGNEPSSKFTDLVGSEPQILSSPDILDVGGQTNTVDPFADEPDQIDLFKNKG